MQKIKNLIHPHGANTATTGTGLNDPIVHDHGTALPNRIVAPGTTATTSNIASSGLNRDRNMNGIPDNMERRNPLDRNGDGRVDLKDLTGRPGYGQQGLAGGLSNDRNMNGIPDNLERTSGFGTTGLSNDRNMNGIPDSLERGSGLSGGFSQDRNMNGIPDSLEYQQSSNVRVAPAHIEVIEKGVVVHEHIHPVEKEEIQPIIYREREQLDVKQITQQLHETQIQPTLVQQRELAAEVRAPVVERAAPIQENIVLPSVDRDATMRSVQVNQPIVNEMIKKTVIEEIQPVLERDVITPTVIQETLPIYEKVVEAPHVYRETLPVRELGTQQSYQREIIMEAPIAPAPVMAAPVQQPTLQPVQVTTTTTTTDSFIPAKLIHDEARSGVAHRNAAPTGRKLF